MYRVTGRVSVSFFGEGAVEASRDEFAPDQRALCAIINSVTYEYFNNGEARVPDISGCVATSKRLQCFSPLASSLLRGRGRGASFFF